MAALTLFTIFSLLVSTTFATDDLENTLMVEKEERPAFQALPLQLDSQRKTFYFHVYFHEIFEGKGKTTEKVISPNAKTFPYFGEIGIMDVPLWDTLYEENIIARAQGAEFQADQRTLGWLLTYNIVFDYEPVKGSTLQVMGRALQNTGRREWSIVGGTGNLTLATGQVYGRRLSSPDDSLWIELKIVGYYTPMERPPWN